MKENPSIAECTTDSRVLNGQLVLLHRFRNEGAQDCNPSIFNRNSLLNVFALYFDRGRRRNKMRGTSLACKVMAEMNPSRAAFNEAERINYHASAGGAEDGKESAKDAVSGAQIQLKAREKMQVCAAAT